MVTDANAVYRRARLPAWLGVCAFGLIIIIIIILITTITIITIIIIVITIIIIAIIVE